jgi:hypothetical protein
MTVTTVTVASLSRFQELGVTMAFEPSDSSRRDGDDGYNGGDDSPPSLIVSVHSLTSLAGEDGDDGA